MSRLRAVRADAPWSVYVRNHAGSRFARSISHDGIDFPHFATFPLQKTHDGRQTVHDDSQSVIDTTRRDHTSVVMETPTWRASADWGTLLGYSSEQLDEVNRNAVTLLGELRAANAAKQNVISDDRDRGPRGEATPGLAHAGLATRSRCWDRWATSSWASGPTPSRKLDLRRRRNGSPRT